MQHLMEKSGCQYWAPRITIVCCVGNEQIFKLRLGASLHGHKGEYKLIRLGLDKTLAEAYNSINLESIKSRYILFVHEDVYFYNKNWIKRVENQANMADALCKGNLGVAGVAGLKAGVHAGYVDHWGSRGMPRRRGWGDAHWDGKIVDVQTVDAQFILVKKSVFQNHKFDENFPFHMMCEDYCLSLKYEHKLKNFVIPVKVWHNEAGLARKSQSHGNVNLWHTKLWQKWHTKVPAGKIYVTSRAQGINPKSTQHYCPKCGGDVDTLTQHLPNPKYLFECRICHYKWGKRR